MSRLLYDKNGNVIQLAERTSPQVIAVNGSAGAAVLSAAITKNIVRMQPTVDMYFLMTVAGSVTASTGHFMQAGGCYDEPISGGNTKVSLLAVGASAGTCYLSELG